MQWLETVGTTVLTSALFMTIATLIIKYLFDKKLEMLKQESQRNLEEYKIKSGARQQRLSEKLKASLAMKSTEHGVRYKKLHERMAAVLDELFTKLERSYYNVNNYSSDLQWGDAPPKEEQHNTAQQSVAELSDQLRRNSLFIPDSINSAVQDYLVRARSITRALKHTLDMENAERTRNTVDTEAVDEDVGELGAVYTGIRTQLQELLGLGKAKGTA